MSKIAERMSDVGGCTLFRCKRCGRTKDIVWDRKGGTGYAAYEGMLYCYDCCGLMDREWMVRIGQSRLYLTLEGQVALGEYGRGEVSNWCGTLSFPAAVRRVSHNMSWQYYHVWIDGPDGFMWYGTGSLQNGQNITVRRTKTKSCPVYCCYCGVQGTWESIAWQVDRCGPCRDRLRDEGLID